LSKILMLVTSHATLGETKRATGVYLPELAYPYEIFEQAGHQVEIASPQGGQAPVDPNSLTEELIPALALLEHTHAFHQIQESEYDACLLVGGHGAMWDFPADGPLQALLAGAWERGSVIAAVCHGVAGLLHVTTSDGRLLLAGKRVTGFSNVEEEAVGLHHVVPFLLEDALKQTGAQYTGAPAWQAHLVMNGNLITGQNPASARKVAEAVCVRLRFPHAQAHA
jgi:putative intracellular protease/amidase